jgi:hypothetical protein
MGIEMNIEILTASAAPLALDEMMGYSFNLKYAAARLEWLREQNCEAIVYEPNENCDDDKARTAFAEITQLEPVVEKLTAMYPGYCIDREDYAPEDPEFHTDKVAYRFTIGADDFVVYYPYSLLGLSGFGFDRLEDTIATAAGRFNVNPEELEALKAVHAEMIDRLGIEGARQTSVLVSHYYDDVNMQDDDNHELLRNVWESVDAQEALETDDIDTAGMTKEEMEAAVDEMGMDWQMDTAEAIFNSQYRRVPFNGGILYYLA